MKLPANGVRLVLILLYLVAVWARMGDAGVRLYPYFKGSSGTNYRHAQLITESGTLPQLDRKSSWPDGYAPAKTQANGAEYAVGFSYRLATLFSDASEKEFTRLFTILFFCLIVFTMNAFVSRLWSCQAAGLFAAFLTAFFSPLVELTNGREFHHWPFAAVLIPLHLSLLVSYMRKKSRVTLALAAIVSAAILAVWEGAGTYLVFYAIAVMVVPGATRSGRAEFLGGQFAAAIVTPAIARYLDAQGWPFAMPPLFLAISAALLTPTLRRGGRIGGIGYKAIGIAAIVAAMWLLRGDSSGTPSALEYWFNRLRFVAGKPDNPAALPEALGHAWSYARSFPTGYDLFSSFLPLVFFIPPAVMGLRRIRKETHVAVWPAIAFAAGACCLYLLDRSTVLVAAIGVATVLSAAFYGFSQDVAKRALPVCMGVFLVFVQFLFPDRIAASLGIVPRAPSGFLWVSIGNADEELVRYIVKSTSVSDVYLASPEMSSLLVTFAGRTTTLTPGSGTSAEMERTVKVTAKFYGDERALYEACKSLEVKYVLYGIDVLLDTSKYSPGYLAGFRYPGESSVVYDMHFHPENLRHFTLVYENDNYRLFRVSDTQEPFFLTDHPVVYQSDILERHENSLEAFYERVLDLLVTYHLAVQLQGLGDEEGAILRFRYCLEQAPRFTKAWLGAGDSLQRLNDLVAALAAYKRVLDYAPDNTHALYNSALVLGKQERTDEALQMIEVLFASSRDRETLRQARVLRSVLQSGGDLDETTP
jgi:tetratricopeptide (TPR) repeat protein